MSYIGRLRLVVAVVLSGTSAAVVAGCGDDDHLRFNANPTVALVRELSDAGLGRYLNTAPSEMQPNGAWDEYHYDPAAHEAMCFGGGAYQVNVHRGTSNNVLLYLEGGGACWNQSTCWDTPVAKSSAGSATPWGILDLNDAANPFRDWTVVYAPYCDGSLFAGDNIVDYGPHRTYHHGLYNLSAAVALLKREVPDPSLLVVSGSSAGGYGTFTGYGVARIAFPDTHILVLNDSGPGFENPAKPQATAERIEHWQYTRFLPADCLRCTDDVVYLAEWALGRDPALRIAYFNYQQDEVLRFFLQFDMAGFEAGLKAVSGGIAAEFPTRFKRYLPIGTRHTVLPLPTFYKLSVDGTVVRDWVSDFLVDGPAWRDIVEE